MKKKVLIAGASGVVGYAAMKHLAGLPDCEVIAVSRRKPDETYGATFLSVDLADEAACADAFGAMGGVTHLVYAALYEKPGLVAGWRERDQIDLNDRMLRNLFEPLSRAASGLRHVSLLQGTKAYGAHIRPIDIPARENRSEVEHENFYWRQQDYILGKQKGRDWAWTIFRPQLIFGEAIGAAMNLIPAIGAYAAILKERGEPLAFPGGAPVVLEAVDADLLAAAIAWAGEAPKAANEIFNVTNGDVFVWPNVWPAIASALGMETAPAAPRSVGAFLAGASADWEIIREKYALSAPALPAFLGESHHYADFCMAYGLDGVAPPAIVSTVKLRQAGFHEVMDTEVMFRKWFRRFQEKRLLPPV